MSKGKYCIINNAVLYRSIKEMKNGSIKIKDAYENLKFLLEHFKVKIKYNLMTRRREIFIPGIKAHPESYEESMLYEIREMCVDNDLPHDELNALLYHLARKKTYHPIIKLLKKNPWDGIPRLDDFTQTIKSTQPDLDKILIKTWMTAAIAAAFTRKGSTTHGVLVLQGEQGVGKTEWFKSLDPFPSKEAVKVGYLMDPKNKDSVIGANRFWIVELGELDATFNRADIALLKSHITSDVDDVRIPWDKCESRLFRRTVYGASINKKQFLVDETGNRRWWTIEATEIDYHHKFDMVQVWAEVYHFWKLGALTYLPNDIQNQLNESNKKFEVVDPLKESLLTNYDWEAKRERWMSATDVYKEMFNCKPQRGEAIRIGCLLSELNVGKSKILDGVKRYPMPLIKFKTIY